MEIEELPLKECFLIRPRVFEDLRGRFVKPIIASELETKGLCFNFVEQYHSISKAGVIRGMHFQMPLYDHVKLVYCALGEVTDVILDLRRDSSMYGQYFSLSLSDASGQALYLASGVAHGFMATREPALMVYNVSTEYAPEHDAGVWWDSFGFEWWLEKLIVSERDRNFPTLENFLTPF